MPLAFAPVGVDELPSHHSVSRTELHQNSPNPFRPNTIVRFDVAHEGKQPVRIVIDPLGEIDDDSNLVRTAHQAPTWLLASEDVDPRRSGHLQDLGVQVLHIPTAEGPRRLHLGRAFKELRRRGLRRVLVEGGGGLVAQMFAWNAVDQVLAFVAPKIIGGQSAPTPVGGDGRPFMAEAWQLRDVRMEAYGQDMAIAGFV